VLASDNKSFFAYELPSADNIVSVMGDTVMVNNYRYRLNGKGFDSPVTLKQINASQEFWHSWKTFHPETLKY